MVRGFTITMIWSVVVGTCSSVYVASPMIIHLNNLRREVQETPAAGAA